ncbi:unnamed protein product [Triticum turgidum subsp. durum]|uniref:Vacuolar iron transporter n=1 Tax=Triticum turgidum subsp. durum TaxID=4567 RepID=A0A9R1PSZ8_TRITD|nr:unnamed protein product [Triticum turgidum subsp. durum]
MLTSRLFQFKKCPQMVVENNICPFKLSRKTRSRCLQFKKCPRMHDCEFSDRPLCHVGRYLAAQSEADHYKREMKREQEEIIAVPDTEAAEIGDIMAEYGLEPHEYGPVVEGLRRNPQAWLEFMMRFELGLEKPDPRRALQSALTIALSYIIGGLVPLLPYMFISTVQDAMLTSVGVTLLALLFFGYIKGRFTGNRPFLSAVQTTIIGAVASAAAYGMAKAVQAR